MKSQKIKVFAITVNYNNPLDTLKCVKSLSSLDRKGLDLGIIVVNNGCTDSSNTILPKKLKNVHFIYSDTNLGFAGGNNLGIVEAIKQKADYVLLINNDAWIESVNLIQELIRHQKSIISPLVHYKQNGQDVYDFGGLVDWLFGRNTHLISKNPKAVFTQKPDYYSGACLLINTSVFKKTMLDDGFFLYFEDVDFVLGAKKRGFSIDLCPHVQIFHNLSASSSKLGKRKIKILADSHLRFCRRHLTPLAFPLYLAFNLYLRFKLLLP